METNDKSVRSKQVRKKKPLQGRPNPVFENHENKWPSNQAQQHPERRPLLDDRVPAMLIDAISSVNAAIGSASVRVPYSEARQAMALNEQEKHKLTRAIQGVAEKHPPFFAQNKEAIEFCVAWAAVQAAHIDNFLTLTDNTNAVQEPGCSSREALLGVLLVLGPLLIFAGISIVQHLRRV
jgi:hypothetical protein